MVLFGVKNRYSTRSNLLQVIINYDQCGGSYEVFCRICLGIHDGIHDLRDCK